MLTTTYQRAYPKDSIATVILFILLVGVPGLLTALNPGGNRVWVTNVQRTPTRLMPDERGAMVSSKTSTTRYFIHI